MKKQIATLLLIAVTTATFAQEKIEKKEQKIIVRKKGNPTGTTKEEKVTVIVDGNKVTVNGKPVDEFKDGEIEIMRGNAEDFGPNGPKIIQKRIGAPNNKALLGVTTDKHDLGAIVVEVSEETAAAKAGLKKDDIITKINDATITSPADLTEAIGKYKPDEKITIVYVRDGKTETTTATLGKRKPMVMTFNSSDFNDGFNEDFNFAWGNKPKLGLHIQDVEEGTGVKVIDVDDETPAAKAGFKTNDIITTVDGADIKNVDDLKTKLKDTKDGKTYKVEYKRNGKMATAEIKYPKKLKTATL